MELLLTILKGITLAAAAAVIAVTGLVLITIGIYELDKLLDKAAAKVFKFLLGGNKQCL